MDPQEPRPRLVRLPRIDQLRRRGQEAGPIPEWALEVAATLKPLATEEEVAALLRTHPKTLGRWRRKGKVTPLKTDPSGSGRVLYARSEVARLIASLRSA